jgi:hypothetical protein
MTKNYFSSDNYEFFYLENKFIYDIVNPLIEIKRGEIMANLINFFKKKINQNTIKYNDIILRFSWKNYTNIDPVIPYRTDSYNTEQMELDLSFYNIKSENIFKKIGLDKYIEKQFNEFRLYYDLHKNIIIKDIFYKNEKIYFKDIIIDVPTHIFNKLSEAINNEDKINIIFCTLYRYNIMDARNQQLAIHPSLNYCLKKEFNIDYELFGSAINKYYNMYCSLFYDLEKYYGSFGNFFNFVPIKGIYMMNPPFDEEIMYNSMIHICQALKQSKEKLGFFITIPIWDIETLLKIQNKNVFDYGKYRALEVIDNSEFLFKKYIFVKNNFPYYNYNLKKMVYASNTYFIIMKNKYLEIDIHKIKKCFKNNNMIFENL